MQRFFEYARKSASSASDVAPGATITVYNTGTLVISTIYEDTAGNTQKANPFTASELDGFFYFYAADGSYDVRISGTGVTTPYTWSDIFFDGVAAEGSTGTSGYSGYSGAQGTSGYSGYSGDSGISGFSGISGYSGYSGDSGISGYSGSAGESGYSGYSGISGFSGFSGANGSGAGDMLKSASGTSGNFISFSDATGAATEDSLINKSTVMQKVSTNRPGTTYLWDLSTDHRVAARGYLMSGMSGIPIGGTQRLRLIGSSGVGEFDFPTFDVECAWANNADTVDGIHSTGFIPASGLTAKGALITAHTSGTPFTLPVGSDRKMLTSLSSVSGGLSWVDSPNSLMTAKGDLLAATAANTPARLAVGTDYQVLASKSSAVTGMAWVGQSFVDITQRGCVGDNSTDNNANFAAALSAVASTGGTLYIPPGIYRLSGAYTISSGVKLLGASLATSLLRTTSASNTVLSISSTDAVHLQDFGIDASVTRNDAAIAILLGSSGAHNFPRLSGLYLANHGISIDSARATAGVIRDCVIYHKNSAASIGIKVRNLVTADAGDTLIEGCLIQNAAGAANGYCVYQTSSGGLRLIGNKFLSSAWGYYGNFDGATSVLSIAGNSFESVNGVYLGLDGGSFGAVTIVGNEFGNWASNAKCIQIGGAVVGGSICGNHIGAAYGTSVGVQFDAGANLWVVEGNDFYQHATGISVNAAATNIAVGLNHYVGITTPVSDPGNVLGWSAGGALAVVRPVYTVANGSADRGLNVTGDNVAQVAAVLGTLIGDLQANGVLK